MESKYFTPDIEDITIGYECEYHNNYGFEVFNDGKEEWIPIKIKLKKKEGAYVSEFENITIGMDDGYQPVRVPYLTREQIISEGWEHTGGKLLSSATQIYNKNLYMLGYNESNRESAFLIRDPSTVPNYYLAPTFRGECKDINTFRTICKLLKI